MACASENDPSEASIDVFEGIFYCCICGDIAAQHRQKTLKRTVCLRGYIGEYTQLRYILQCLPDLTNRLGLSQLFIKPRNLLNLKFFFK